PPRRRPAPACRRCRTGSGSPGLRRLRRLRGAAAVGHLDQPVERVAQRPRRLGGRGERARAQQPRAERLAHALATALALALDRRALVDAEAGLAVALVVERRAQLDGLADRIDRLLDVVVGAALEDLQLVVRHLAHDGLAVVGVLDLLGPAGGA